MERPDLKRYRVMAWEDRPRPGRIQDFVPFDDESDSGNSSNNQILKRISSSQSTFSDCSTDVFYEDSVDCTSTSPNLHVHSTLRYPNTKVFKSDQVSKQRYFCDSNSWSVSRDLSGDKESTRMSEDKYSVSPATFKFFDKDMVEQKTLSQRVSAQLLRKSAMRASIPKNRRSQSVNQSNHSVTPKPPTSKPLPVNTKTLPRTVPRMNPSLLKESKNLQKNDDKRTDRQNFVTVQGKRKCSRCNLKLGQGHAMAIEALNLVYHMQCFRCDICGQSLLDKDLKEVSVKVSGSEIRCRHCFDVKETGFLSSRI